jgi:hypothetical protein
MTVTVNLKNNAISKLASSLTSGATTLSVTTGEGAKFPTLTAGQWFPLTLVDSSNNVEVMRCTGRATDVLTVTRAQEGTSARAFAAGDRVELRLTAAALSESFTALQTDISAAQSAISSFLIFRNKLINPKGNVNQRAYVSGTNTTGANQYTLDRWRVVTSGQNLAFAAVDSHFQMTAPAGGLEQVIEGVNIEGGTYRLSWTGTATAKVNGTTIANGALTAALTANTDVTVTFASGTVELPQFELNSVTAFEERLVGLETMLCQRYYEQIDCIAMGYNTTGNAIATCQDYKAVKRTTPSVAVIVESVRITNTNVGGLNTRIGTESLLVYRNISSTGHGQFHTRYGVSAEF